MDKHSQIFEKFVDETGEEYYCPMNALAVKHIVSEGELDNCAEVSTANRYSRNINVVDSSKS
jgi:hypothetical protein